MSDIDNIITAYENWTIPIKNRYTDLTILDLPSNEDSCKGVEMYTYYFNDALSPFLRNKFNVNDEILKFALDSIVKVDDHVKDDDDNWYESRLENILYFDKYIKPQKGDCLINNTYLKKFEIDEWRYTNIPDKHNHYRIRSNYVYDRKHTIMTILPPFDLLTIAKNWVAYSDNVLMDGKPFDIKHWTKLLVGRFLTNMYLSICNGFIKCPKQIVVFSGMSRESYRNNYKEFGDLAITNKIISTSMDEDTSISFLTTKDGYNPVLLRIFLPKNTPILPVTDSCRAANLGTEYEIILNYACSLKIIDKHQEMRIVNTPNEYVKRGVSFEQLLDYMLTIDLKLTREEQYFLSSNSDQYVFKGNDTILAKINKYASEGREPEVLSPRLSYQVYLPDVIDMTLAKDDEVFNLVLPIVRPDLVQSVKNTSEREVELNKKLQIARDLQAQLDSLLTSLESETNEDKIIEINKKIRAIKKELYTMKPYMIKYEIESVKDYKKHLYKSYKKPHKLLLK